ncbi:hypothetical protein C8Q79DRAFT_920041 [Trametes meyenii]|nr:hypothetical protein C8Q79DRAFT_920041 [Trametes meyenii]
MTVCAEGSFRSHPRQHYLKAFRCEPNMSFFRAAYLPVPIEDETVSSSKNGNEEVPRSPTDISDEAPSPATSSSHLLRASLFPEGIESFGEWPIMTSARAQRDLRKTRKEDAKKFKIIVKKIQELSRGHFSDDNHKKLTGMNVGVPIYEAKMSRDLRLVYQIHCTPQLGTNVLIRIFGVYTHAHLDGRFWDAMSRTLECQGVEYKKRCTARSRMTHRRGDNVVLPCEFPPRAPEQEALLNSKSSTVHCASDLLCKCDRGSLIGILADQDVAHVFGVSQREKEIIEHPHSCIVIGKYPPVTRKTTTILFKMLGIERSWETSGEGMERPRQLFITQSRVLAEKVEEYYEKLQQSLATAKCSPAELKEIAAKGRQRRRQRLVNADEQVFLRSDLPQRYGDLEDAHYPMFLTYEHLCRLLEREFEHKLREADKRSGATRDLQDALRLRQWEGGFRRERDENGILDYKGFLHTYWAHFPQDLIKGLDPDLAFSEFLGIYSTGVIQGSERALDSEGGYLDKETYYSITRHTATTSSAQREAVYALFMLYRKKKKQLWQRDAADSFPGLRCTRTFELVKSLREGGIPGRPVDFLYVDEAQDNLLIDTLVMRALCPNPRGIFWAGDTAQTISAGSTFRFSELKASLHPSRPNLSSSTLTLPPLDPMMFHLTSNYRSHAGIVDCAASIVQLITRFWPDSVDALPQEKGMAAGPKPAFFWNYNGSEYTHFFQGVSGSPIEFGAHQCILVRNEATKRRLRTKVGELGVILTISESKGLEFNDVLLFDPFEDSTAEYQQWRIVLDGVPGEMAPAFEDSRHSGVCRELKFLYVAVTRARMNLWIMDGSRKGEPMRRFWNNAGLVEGHASGMPIPQLAVSSGKEEWAEVAWSLFHKNQYSEAELAFSRAGRQREQRVAHAYVLRDIAWASLAGGLRGCGSAEVRPWVDAAKAFSKSGQEAEDGDDKRTYYLHAAKCYVKAGGNDRYAAEAFYLAQDYEEAAKHFRAAGMFDEAVGVVKHHTESVDRTVSDNILSVSKLQFLRKNEVEKAHALFDSSDEALEYMAGYGLETPRASLLEQLGRFTEAAESQLGEGNILEAVRLFLMDRENADSPSRAGRAVLDALWPRLAFLSGYEHITSTVSNDAHLRELLAVIKEFSGLSIEDALRDEMSMFQAIAYLDFNHLIQLSRNFGRASNLPAQLVCLDYVFSVPLALESKPPKEIVACFSKFLDYAGLLQRFACNSDPSNNAALQRLFGFASSDDEDRYLLRPTSIIVSQRRQQDTGAAKKDERGILISRWDLEKAVKTVLRGRLSTRVMAQNEMCHHLRSIRPCLLFATSGRCPRYDCQQYHIEDGSDRSTVYNTFVRIHILQIMIYHTLYATGIPSRELFFQQRGWLRRLYEALYPSHYMLGSIHLLSAAGIPELQRGRKIIALWVQDFLNTLYPTEHAKSFLNNLMRATRLAMVFDRNAASKHLHRIPSMDACRWAPSRFRMRRDVQMLWRDNAYVVHDLMRLMQNNHADALDRGVLFLNHILGKRLPIDIDVLCDFMDHLCGSLIVAIRLRARGNLHDITLPKSWVARIAHSDIRMLEVQRTRHSVEYKLHFAELLQQVYTGNDAAHLLFENVDLSAHGLNRTRNLYIARICRNLCLWGYNLRSWELRQEIVWCLQSVGQAGELILSPTISAYLHAHSWNDLAKAVRASTTRTSLDEMVQLWHTAVPQSDTGSAHVRRIPFNRNTDIVSIFVSTDQLEIFGASSSATSGLEDAFPGSTLDVRSAVQVGTHTEDGDDLALARSEGNLQCPSHDLRQGEHTDDEAPEQISMDLSPSELEAATKIADTFKQYWARVQGMRDPMQERLRRIYAQFRAQAQRTTWSRTKCRVLFLGPLPHAYLGVECTKNHLSTVIAQERERLKVIDHLELEVAQSTMDRLAELLDNASRLHAELSPAAVAHGRCGESTIKRCIQQADNLVGRVEADMKEAFTWRKDVDLAMRMVAQSLGPSRSE